MQIKRKAFIGFVSLVLAAMPFVAHAAGSTLNVVKQRGHLQCGVSQGLPGFSNPDDKGNWTGIDVDFCKAVAAAIFGDAKKVKFTPLSAKERFTAIQSGEVDIIARNTTWSMHRDTALGVDFRAVNYYDGQGFIVRGVLGLTSTTELDGATLCTNQGTTTDHSALYAQRLKLTDPQAHIVLPEIISKEPLGPAVRQGDNVWGDIVAWVHYATVAAEELGVSSKNIDKMGGTSNPSIKRLLGRDGTFGRNLGIPDDWALQAIKQVGNYGEIFERNVGVNTPLGIKRGYNALWTAGGLQYAPPIR